MERTSLLPRPALIAAAISFFVSATDLPAQTPAGVSTAPPPWADIKYAAEPSVQTFPSERAARRHPAAHTPGDRSAVRIDSVDRAPVGWSPNQPDSIGPKPMNHSLDPRVPKQGLRPIDHSRMYYRETDGTLWARGEHYKASFDARGATYYPIFGKRATHHSPHVLSPDQVTVGGEPLALERASDPVRVENRIEIDRGAFVEAYDLTAQALEQTFEFTSLPRSGDLVVHIPVASELAACTSAEGLEFRGDLGRVTFGRATAIDARGRRAAASTELADGAITIRVDAGVLSTLELPLVIDPVVSTFAIDDTQLDAYWADAAYASQLDRWLVVYEDWVTSTDRDCWGAELTNDGSVVGYYAFDLSTDSWDSVHVADGSSDFVIAASITHAGVVSVQALLVWAQLNGDLNFFSPYMVSGTETGTVRNCVIGGRGDVGFCIVYERQYSATDWDILARFVREQYSFLVAYPLNNPIYVSNSAGTVDVGPAISKSPGGHDWMIAWQRNNGYANDADVWGAIMHVDGNLTAPPFQISAWFQPEWQVAVSSPLGHWWGQTPTPTMRYLVTWQVTDGGDNDIVMALLDGTTKLDQQDLSIDEQYNYTLDQVESSVDSDGDQFLVAYSELYSGTDYDIYASDVYVSASNALGLLQRHMNLDYDTTRDHSPRVVSMAMSGVSVSNHNELANRFYAAWNSSPNPVGPADVRGALFDGFALEQASSFCFGDGTGAPCPCGNNGFFGHGCQNSSGTGGGLLIASGVARFANGDSLLFTTQNEKPSGLSTVTQGNVQISPVTFGQGLRCAGGNLLRLYTHPATNGTIQAPLPGELDVWTRSANMGDAIQPGTQRYYFVYYRDALVLGGCPSTSTFNTTQAVAVTWHLE